MGLNLDQTREAFESSTDFTIGLEEEFALLDPANLSLANAFERLFAAAGEDDLLAQSVAGELISSEIEIRSGKGEDFMDAVARQSERRNKLFALAAQEHIGLGATGTHPWSPWQDQRIINTPHYRRVADDLQYVAWRNNTFSLHVHVGMRGADRAVAVCDAMRTVLPTLLAVSANSAFIEGAFSGLHTARTEVFTRMFPRCGIPDFFGGWAAYREYVELLLKTRSIIEHTQIWWSVRPHLGFGTVEVRIMDAQSRADESTALAALATACVAQAAVDYDEGLRPEAVPGRLIEENLWRAIRYGLDGRLIDFEREREITAIDAAERLLSWTAPVRAELRLDDHLGAITRMLEQGNGAQRQWRRHESGEPASEIYAATVAETCVSYSDSRAGVCGHLEGVTS
jgi:glutamate---cysteine ligase / carboxylate-amine ligase